MLRMELIFNKMMNIIILFTTVFVIVKGNGNITRSNYRCDYVTTEKLNLVYSYHEVPDMWHNAALRCFMEGGNLLYFISNAVIELFVPQSTQIYLGFHATFSSGDFFSIATGIPLSNFKFTWASGQPQYRPGYDCLAWKDRQISLVSCLQPLPYLCVSSNKKTDARKTKCGTSDSKYEYNKITNKCYKFHRDMKPWSRAYLTCAAELGQLLIIKSKKESDIIKELFAKHPPGSIRPNYTNRYNYHNAAYIGFTDWGEHSAWAWRTIEGQTVEQAGFAEFSPTEPRNSSGNYCGAVERDGLLDDFSCFKPLAFICEKAPEFDAPCSNYVLPERSLNDTYRGREDL